MIASWLTALLLMAWARREVAAGRPLFAAPRRWLARIGRGHLLFAAAFVALMLGLLWLMKADGVMLVALGWPEMAALAASIDLPALLDLAVIALVAAGQARFGSVRRRLSGIRRSPNRAQPRRRRARRRTAPRAAANDEEDRWSRAA